MSHIDKMASYLDASDAEIALRILQTPFPKLLTASLPSSQVGMAAQVKAMMLAPGNAKSFSLLSEEANDWFLRMGLSKERDKADSPVFGYTYMHRSNPMSDETANAQQDQSKNEINQMVRELHTLGINALPTDVSFEDRNMIQRLIFLPHMKPRDNSSQLVRDDKGILFLAYLIHKGYVTQADIPTHSVREAFKSFDRTHFELASHPSYQNQVRQALGQSLLPEGKPMAITEEYAGTELPRYAMFDMAADMPATSLEKKIANKTFVDHSDIMLGIMEGANRQYGSRMLAQPLAKLSGGYMPLCDVAAGYQAIGGVLATAKTDAAEGAKVFEAYTDKGLQWMQNMQPVADAFLSSNGKSDPRGREHNWKAYPVPGRTYTHISHTFTSGDKTAEADYAKRMAEIAQDLNFLEVDAIAQTRVINNPDGTHTKQYCFFLPCDQAPAQKGSPGQPDSKGAATFLAYLMDKGWVHSSEISRHVTAQPGEPAAFDHALLKEAKSDAIQNKIMELRATKLGLDTLSLNAAKTIALSPHPRLGHHHALTDSKPHTERHRHKLGRTKPDYVHTGRGKGDPVTR